MQTTTLSRIGLWAAWGFVALVLVFLYAPLIPPAVNSFEGAGGDKGLFVNYAAILTDQRLVAAGRISLTVGLLVALISPLLALLAAEAVRVWRIPKLVLGVLLIPLFVPGISMGVATALFFQTLGIQPSLLTITAVQVIWALPFAFLIILTVMANFDPVYREAAYMSGANRLQAFFEVELPQIHPGILGAAVFSLILSFNETIRTSVVQGGRNTVQTYLWSQYQQVGLSPNLYALMTVLIVATLLLIGALAVMDMRAGRNRG
ncbi:ABC transporter permease [Futiania mangrovi]|uniref:ABC transporter permease subunit n=1 Tax=Futiania mangrovi TaxID=2959716 RepID=A0A9J6PEF5_9PROT|nr:ABC transporter permease subunit [Futiania mangrovii]MCP1337065.1 ABC transporter permease subunit [Futiania mangrovii]